MQIPPGPLEDIVENKDDPGNPDFRRNQGSVYESASCGSKLQDRGEVDRSVVLFKVVG